MSDSEAALETLVKRINADSVPTLQAPDVDLLLSSFLPSEPTQQRSHAYLCLAQYASNIRHPSGPVIQGSEDQATDILARTFFIAIETRLADTSESSFLGAMSFLAAFFQVDPLAASNIFKRDGIIESLMETVELSPASPDVKLALANLLSQASGNKECRAVVGESSKSWLEAQIRQTSHNGLRAAAAIALTKLYKGTAADEDAVAAGVPPQDRSVDEEKLAVLMKNLLLDDEHGPILDSVEGLAYMSIEPKIKELIANDERFLKRLFSLIPSRTKSALTSPEETKTSLGLFYGIALILANVCAYRPRLSEEQIQIDRLKRMAKGGIGTGKLEEVKEEVLEEDVAVKQRCQKVVKAGGLAALGMIARSGSHSVCSAAGRAYLSVVEDKENRGVALQNGAVKALMIIIQVLLPLPKEGKKETGLLHPNVQPADVLPIQALCKLAITASPALLFGPSPSGSYDAIRPFTLLLLHDSSTLLQKFESLMALTNLTSMGPDVSARVAKVKGLLNNIDTLLLHDNVLIRRAATELLCNLISCEEVFQRFTPFETAAGAPSSRLQILVALSDVHDLQTRKAASGALAMLSSDPGVCRVLYELEMEKHRVLYTMLQLILNHAEEEDREDDRNESLDPDLLHRGIICIRNFLKNVPSSTSSLAKTAETIGMVEALVGHAKGIRTNHMRDKILAPLQEVLFILTKAGIDLKLGIAS